jgi:heme-degrading monooxygenase HmoA
MAVARISIMRPMQGHEKHVEELLDELEEHLSKLPGYIMGFRFAAHRRPGEVGRLGLWATREDADNAAQNTHTLDIRARLHLAIEAGHEEWMMEVQGSPKNIPPPLTAPQR